MRISDWSSDVCSSDLHDVALGDETDPLVELDHLGPRSPQLLDRVEQGACRDTAFGVLDGDPYAGSRGGQSAGEDAIDLGVVAGLVEGCLAAGTDRKSTRLNQSLMRISYAVFCLKKKTKSTQKSD